MADETQIDSHEREVAQDLLKDFAADSSVTPEIVYKLSWERYIFLENEVPVLSTMLKEFKSGNKENYQFEFFDLPLILHHYIYSGLYTFAGRYRSEDDPSSGNIFFGKVKGHNRSPEFSGTISSGIGEEILESISRLIEPDPDDPLLKAAVFYQNFVKTHPFYDGNGRLARLIANIYLFDFGLTINWSEFDSKPGFVRKLNWCHKAGTQKALMTYAEYIRKFTINLDSLES